MARIRLKVGDVISYYGHLYEVVEVYPYIAGIRKTNPSSRDLVVNNGVVYIGIGDLVMSGLGDKVSGIGMLPSGPSTLEKNGPKYA